LSCRSPSTRSRGRIPHESARRGIRPRKSFPEGTASPTVRTLARCLCSRRARGREGEVHGSSLRHPPIRTTSRGPGPKPGRHSLTRRLSARARPHGPPALALLAALLLFSVAGPAGADDWPQWLGPQRDGVWRETGILEKFPKGGPKVRWRQEIGGGYAGPA